MHNFTYKVIIISFLETHRVHVYMIGSLMPYTVQPENVVGVIFCSLASVIIMSSGIDCLSCRQLLAVDYLCEEIDHIYPPHSLKALLSVFETSNILAQDYFVS